MTYQLRTDKKFDRAFKKLDPSVQRMLRDWIEKNLMDCEDPRNYGKALVGNFKNIWRYRIGNYRLLCKIDDGELVIFALNVGHGKEIYK